MSAELSEERARVIRELEQRIAELTRIAGLSKNGLPAMMRVAECQRMLALLR